MKEYRIFRPGTGENTRSKILTPDFINPTMTPDDIKTIIASVAAAITAITAAIAKLISHIQKNYGSVKACCKFKKQQRARKKALKKKMSQV